MRKLALVLGITINILVGVYLFWPSRMQDVFSLPGFSNAVSSKLSGDTVQVTNLRAFFSNQYRDYVVAFYRTNFQKLNLMPFPPLVINHPPEEAYVYVKDQTHSTYLEEINYPLRGSVFVNGLEPFEETTKAPRYSASAYFSQDGTVFETKVTIKYYPIAWWRKFTVWIALNGAILTSLYICKNTKKLLS